LTATCHRFGSIEVRPVERQLLIDGKPAALGARAFDVLLALLERPGRVVTKHELLDLVWPGLVVEENNLQVQVSTLRKLLGAHAIATIPGRGYCFALGAGPGRAAGPATSVAEVAATNWTPPPSAAAPLIGRDQDLERLAALLQQHRLTTVLGGAGVGKTALARVVAEAATAAVPIVAWVELAPLLDAADMPGALARALQLPISDKDVESALLAAVKPLEALLVLDNAEHVLEPLARLVSRLLAGAPGLRLLLTSQAPLRLEGEWLFRLEPLSCPPAEASLEQARAHGAVQLLLAQAHAAGFPLALEDGNLTAVVDICRRLDGVALAIKLAAARLPLLGLNGLQQGLEHALTILGGGSRDHVGRRHETLRAALDWSHGLLSQAERTVFRRLSVFVGGFTLAAAHAVCADEVLGDLDVTDALAALVDRSFVVVDDRPQLRYRLLEPAREYALSQLGQSGESLVIGRRHAQAMLAQVQHVNEAWWYQQQDSLYDLLADDLDNLRAAVSWSIANEPALAVRLTGESRSLFLTAGFMHEARSLAEQVLTLVDAATAVEAARFWRLCIDVFHVDERERSTVAALKALELLRSAGDMRHLAGTLFQAIALTSLTSAAKEQLLLELKQVHQPDWPAHARSPVFAAEGAVAWLRGDGPAARAAYVQAVALARSLRWRAYLCSRLAGIEQASGLLDDAAEHARAAVELAHERGPSNRLLGLVTLAGVLIEQGNLGEARTSLAEAVALSRRAGWWRMNDIARRFILLAAREGRVADAARLLGYVQRLDIRLDSVAHAGETHMQSVGEAAVRASLSGDDLGRQLAAGGGLDEAAVCELGLAALQESGTRRGRQLG
jgi:predicted ATPase